MILTPYLGVSVAVTGQDYTWHLLADCHTHHATATRPRDCHVDPGGGGALDFHLDGGGGGCRWGVENLTLSQTARRTRKYTLSQYTLLKLSYAYPVLVRTDSLFCCVSSYIHKNLLRPPRAVASLVPDRGPVITIVVPHAPSLMPRSRACHKYCGLGTRLGSREATLW